MLDDEINDWINETGPIDPLPPSTLKWRKWFAWYPVVVHGERVWLKTVFRHKIYYRDPPAEWNYGNIFDVLKGQ